MSDRKKHRKKKARGAGRSSDVVEFTTFKGERFALPDRFNYRVFIRFMRAAADGVDTDTLAGMVMLDQMLDAVLRPEDVARFDRVCAEHGAEIEELMEYAMSVVTAVTGRPTRRPADSSAGSPTTSGKSAGGSSSPGIDRDTRDAIEHEEATGRPDRALVVVQAHEARAKGSRRSA